MIQVTAAGRSFYTELFVFDKDGLLFQSKPFWQELANARISAAQKLMPGELINGWMNVMGVDCREDGKSLRAGEIDPLGVFAVASPDEEITITSVYIAERMRVKWIEARRISRQIFDEADSLIDLAKALVPRKGFPEIFQRLRRAGVPYGIATSDTYDRACRSVKMFDDFSKIAFVVTPSDVKQGKPAADMLLHISGLTGITPRHITMVGDSFVDVAMAKNAGAMGIGVPENDEMAARMEASADIIVSGLDKIKF